LAALVLTVRKRKHGAARPISKSKFYRVSVGAPRN
jgi:hypothetical protein